MPKGIRSRRTYVLIVGAAVLLLAVSGAALAANPIGAPAPITFSTATQPDAATSNLAAAPSVAPSVKPVLTPAPAVSPPPTATPTVAPTPTSTVAPTPKPVVTPKPTATPKPKPKATATPKPVVKATPKPVVKPKPTATPKPKPKATATPKPVVKATPTPQPVVKPTATPQLVVVPVATPQPVVQPTATPQADVQPAPTPQPTAAPAPPATTFKKDVYFAAGYERQIDGRTCTAASTAMMMNFLVQKDLNLNQMTILGYEQPRDALKDSVQHGSDPLGWSLAATHFSAAAGVPTTYAWKAYSSKTSALNAAAVALATYGKSVGLIVWNGGHAIVMTGYIATGDPAAGSFTLKSIYTSDPYTTGATVGKHRSSSVDSFAFGWYLQHDATATYNKAWFHKWVIIVPTS